MVLRRLIAVLALVLAGAGGLRAEERFFSAVEDLPLMPGLAEKPGSAVVFDKPEGRIVEMTAEGGVDRAAARAFYDRVLPQLGWRKGADGTFRRESERLRLRFSRIGPSLVLRVTITPE
jgi:hypothetical protein